MKIVSVLLLAATLVAAQGRGGGGQGGGQGQRLFFQISHHQGVKGHLNLCGGGSAQGFDETRFTVVTIGLNRHHIAV